MMRLLPVLFALTFPPCLAAATPPEEQIACDGEALVAKMAAEMRMRNVPRDEVKLQLIIHMQDIPPENTHLLKSLKGGFSHVDWIYDEKFSPTDAYIETFRACARRYGKHYTLQGDRLKLLSAKGETVDHVYIVGK